MNSSLWNPFSEPVGASPDDNPELKFDSRNSLNSSDYNPNYDKRNVSSAAVRGAALWGQRHSTNQTQNESGWNRSNGSRRGHGSFASGNSWRNPQCDSQFSSHRGRGNPRFSVQNNGRSYGNRGGFQERNQSQRSHLNEIYCEACDLEFKNPRLYDEHVQKHLKCPKCQFVGLVDAIEQHYEMMHLAKSKKRSAEFQTDEDLAQWKKERSKKFPRTKQVSASVEAHNEKDFSPFQTHPDVSLHTHENGLGSLMGYGDGTDSEPEEVPFDKSMSGTEETAPCSVDPLISAIPFDSTKDDPAEICADLQESEIKRTDALPVPPTRGSVPVRGYHNSRFPRRAPAGFRRKPKTLYEKLCARDMESDNDKLLQCFEYIRNKNFFQ